MDLNNYINVLKEKYNYNNSLCNFLKILIPKLIEYYGFDKKELILSAIEDTEIHFQEENENMFEYLRNYFVLKKNWNIPYNGAAFLENEYILAGNVISSRSLIYIKQEFFGDFIPFDFNNPVALSNLVHELCHLIKSYGTIDYKNQQLISKSGLINEYYKCNINNGLLVEYKNEYVGLEEALNTIDEEEILSLLNINVEKNNEYTEMANMLKRMFSNEDVKNAFKKSEFNDDAWINVLGDDALKLANYYDEWLRYIYLPIDIVINDDSYNEKVRMVKKNIDFIISKYEKGNVKS